MTNKDYYTDTVLGGWTYNKKKSNKDFLHYERSKEIKLHKDYAVRYTDPEDLKEYKVYGMVILTETKLFEVKTSNQSLFRGVELTKDSVKDIVIK